MKNEALIRINYFQKLAGWMTGKFREEKLKEHIRMLDWVLSRDIEMRSIEEIENEYSSQEREEMSR
jgi:hypothetical protein